MVSPLASAVRRNSGSAAAILRVTDTALRREVWRAQGDLLLVVHVVF